MDKYTRNKIKNKAYDYIVRTTLFSATKYATFFLPNETINCAIIKPEEEEFNELFQEIDRRKGKQNANHG